MSISDLSPTILALAVAAATPVVDPVTIANIIKKDQKFYGFVDGKYQVVTLADVQKLSGTRSSKNPTVLGFGYEGCTAICTKANPNFAATSAHANVIIINIAPIEFSSLLNAEVDPAKADNHRKQLLELGAVAENITVLYPLKDNYNSSSNAQEPPKEDDFLDYQEAIALQTGSARIVEKTNEKQRMFIGATIVNRDQPETPGTTIKPETPGHSSSALIFNSNGDYLTVADSTVENAMINALPKIGRAPIKIGDITR